MHGFQYGNNFIDVDMVTFRPKYPVTIFQVKVKTDMGKVIGQCENTTVRSDIVLYICLENLHYAPYVIFHMFRMLMPEKRS